ncbi:hypothetical protein QBC34DRAFT_426815 [Podospora aff. communis PSN243]|uniref:Uncharacterized protein n=1 Tax=Podospora aff. communis PSN243 TaxID=3040156 RepID=A0AAV9GJS2_9PEZI|nr:hypothetical protein QBC34DRAFT_426815 [Podospora aff. communis PSN243]
MGPQSRCSDELLLGVGGWISNTVLDLPQDVGSLVELDDSPSSGSLPQASRQKRQQPQQSETKFSVNAPAIQHEPPDVEIVPPEVQPATDTTQEKAQSSVYADHRVQNWSPRQPVGQSPDSGIKGQSPPGFRQTMEGKKLASRCAMLGLVVEDFIGETHGAGCEGCDVALLDRGGCMMHYDSAPWQRALAACVEFDDSLLGGVESALLLLVVRRAVLTREKPFEPGLTACHARGAAAKQMNNMTRLMICWANWKFIGTFFVISSFRIDSRVVPARRTWAIVILVQQS